MATKRRKYTAAQCRDLLMATQDSDDSDESSEENLSEGSESEDNANSVDSGSDADVDDNADRWRNGTNFQPVFHQYTGNAGIHVDTTDFELLDFFRLFIDDDLLNCFVIETNRYADQWKRDHPEEYSKKSCRVRKWVPVAKDDMLKFIGLTLLMGLIKKPMIELYWSRDELFKTPVFGRVMARDRYQLILRFIHFVDNDDAPDPHDKNRDRLFKIRPLIDDLNEKFSRFYTPEQNVALDESLILWKGRLLFKQYLPSKRKRFGMKLYNLCENSGYTYRFRVYTGAEDSVHDIQNVLPGDTVGMNKTEKLTVFMMLPLLNKGHTLYVDNWYTSVNLFKYLHANLTNACGTMRRNRVPETVRNCKLNKGDSCTFHCGELQCTKFVDKKEVYILSTLHKSGTTERHVRGRNRATIHKPNSVLEYNLNMGAVDKMDQLLQPYSATRKSMKWYRKLAIHLIQVSMLNAFVIFKSAQGGERTYLQFQHDVLKALLSRGQPNEVQDEVDDESVRRVERHFIIHIPPTPKKQNPTKRCRVCHARGIRRESRFYCNQCPTKPGLCLENGCFKIYHTEENFGEVDI